MARFPRNLERAKIWIANISNNNWKLTTDLYVCETHFANEMCEKVRIDGKKKLKGNAVPTIFPNRLDKCTSISTNWGRRGRGQRTGMTLAREHGLFLYIMLYTVQYQMRNIYREGSTVVDGRRLLLVVLALALICVSFVRSADRRYASARVESCSGCSLNRLPDVKQFVFEDLPQYNDVEFKHIPGATPELVLFDAHEKEVERLVLSKLTREECNDLLVSKGFTKKLEYNKDEM